jgi:hypothetical protein
VAERENREKQVTETMGQRGERCGLLGAGGLNGVQLKWIALITMLIDHTAHVLVEPWSPLYLGMRLAGRLAFPLYSFLLVEGFVHTRDVNRYLGRLGLFALLSELPFDWMNGGLSFASQNVFFTLFLGLLALRGYVVLQNRNLPSAAYLWCAGMCALAWGMRTDYGWAGVALICFLYRFRENILWKTVSGYATLMFGVNEMEVTALASFLLMKWYNGQKGRSRLKWGFYLFYPLHLFILAALRYIIKNVL